MRITVGFWQHRRCTDLQLEIVKVQYRGPRYTKVRVIYWRKDFGCGAYKIDYALHTEKIIATEYENWRRVA